MLCPTCGAEVRSRWRFCRSCGTELSATTGRRRVPTEALAVAGAALILVALAFAGVHAHNRLHETQGRLASTRLVLTKTEASLKSTQADLATRTKERDATRADLATANSKLQDTQRTNQLQGSQLQTLKACLSDLRTAGDALARSDEPGLRAALTVADRDCSAADRLL